MLSHSDVNECVTSVGQCLGGTCHNTVGSFECRCPPGYHVDETGSRCVDMDECDDDLMCQFGCENMVGGYRCDCPVGFSLHFYWNQCVGKLLLP